MSDDRGLASIPTKILLPVDFSLSSHAALEMAADLAKHFGAELYLLSVLPFFPTSTLPDFVPEAAFLQEARAHAELRLTRAMAMLTTRNIECRYAIEVGNDIAGTILEVIEREHVDLVVISTHGLSGWHPLVFGSIAEKVVKLVQCPLLLLRSKKPEAPIKDRAEHSMSWW